VQEDHSLGLCGPQLCGRLCFLISAARLGECHLPRLLVLALRLLFGRDLGIKRCELGGESG
jgi:hypothetical protein